MDVPVYVLCHPEKEKARYEKLIPHLKEVGIPAENIRISAPTWGSQLTADEIFKAYDPYLKRPVPAFTFKAACLSRGEISLCMNFLEAARLAVGPAIILESDVRLRPDFMDRLKDVMASLPADWDYVSLGEGCNTRPANGSYFGPTRLYKPPHKWVFRCTDSMLLSERFLKAVTKTMVPFKECLDWELNWQLMLNGGVALWADPPLAEQGTWNGREETSLP